MGADNAGVGYATPAAVLDRVLDEVLTSSDKWCQGTAAQDAKGGDVAAAYDGAVKFCMIGAMKRAAALELGLIGRGQNEYSMQYWDLMIDTETVVRTVLGGGLTHWFNDSPRTTFEDVRLVFKRARELAS